MKYLIKRFSQTYDLLWYLPNLKLCKGYPEFVIDYIKKVQPFLKDGNSLCGEFPVAPMQEEPESDGDFFWKSADDGLPLGLIWKSGKWYEKKGLIFKKTVPVKDPALWMVNYIEENVDPDPRESDFVQFNKALQALKSMIGRYV